MNGKETHSRADRIANSATRLLLDRDILNASVVVTYKSFYDWPLSIRTPKGDGFGTDKEGFPRLFKTLLSESRLQAIYAQTAGGRTAEEQLKKLQGSNRSASSYGEDFDSELIPNFFVDKDSDLTVVVASKGMAEKDSVDLAKEAVSMANSNQGTEMTSARYFLHCCLAGLNQRLPSDRTAFSMIALPKYREDYFLNSTNRPVVVCSQSDGEVVSPSNFSIVKAKVNAVYQSHKASGPEQENNLSRIKGAIPILVSKHGERIVAAGGLVEGQDDVDAIIMALELFSPKMQISLLEQLTDKSTESR
jgi:hypothetical protein